MSDVPPRIDPVALRSADFPGSFRKYDSRAVDQFLSDLADRVAVLNSYVDELERKAVAPRLAEDPAPAPPGAQPSPPPSLDGLSEDDIVTLVGEETAHVLATARKAADDIRSKAEESAARMIREATAETTDIREEAREEAATMREEASSARDEAVAEAEAEAAGVLEKAAAEAERRITEARSFADDELVRAEQARGEADAEAERIREEARDEGRAMLAEAKSVRTRILEDLQRRRDLAKDQIERLVTGRDRLLDTFAEVREEVDGLTSALAHVLDEPLSPADPALSEGFVGIVSTIGNEDEDDEDRESVELATDDADLDEAEAPAPTAAAEVPTDAAAGTDRSEADTDEHDPDHDDGADEETVETEPAAEAGDDEEPPPPNGDPVDLPPPPDAADDGSGSATSDGAESGDDAGAVDVDELFARIRGDREDAVAAAESVLADGAAGGDAAGADVPGVEGAAEVEGDGDAAIDEAPAPGAEDVADPEDDADEVDGAVERVDPAFLAPPDALAARGEVVERHHKSLTRSLKRLLADEQNEVLDALRRNESTDLGEVFSAVPDHAARYAAAAADELRAVAAAAATAAGGSGDDVDVDTLGAGLGTTLIEPFRRRIERAAEEVDGDHEVLDERFRALYREWKVEHINPAAADALLAAYAAGQFAAAGPDDRLSWRIDPEQGPCPDAQDNALAGAVGKGEEFPTGDRCPQAHSGCRCLLVVADS